MPVRQKIMGACVALGSVLLFAGCGGSQNPARGGGYITNSPALNRLGDGLWDGAWAIPLLLWRMSGNFYPLYPNHFGLAYFIGFAIAALVVAGAIAGLLAWLGLRGFMIGMAAMLLVIMIFSGKPG